MNKNLCKILAVLAGNLSVALTWVSLETTQSAVLYTPMVFLQ